MLCFSYDNHCDPMMEITETQYQQIEDGTSIKVHSDGMGAPSGAPSQ
jgi:hypothetical protein